MTINIYEIERNSYVRYAVTPSPGIIFATLPCGRGFITVRKRLFHRSESTVPHNRRVFSGGVFWHFCAQRWHVCLPERGFPDAHTRRPDIQCLMIQAIGFAHSFSRYLQAKTLFFRKRAAMRVGRYAINTINNRSHIHNPTVHHPSGHASPNRQLPISDMNFIRTRRMSVSVLSSPSSSSAVSMSSVSLSRKYSYISSMWSASITSSRK